MSQVHNPNPIKKPANTIIVRHVWDDNMEYELHLISSLIGRYPFVAMDTEFPGVIYHPNAHPMALSVPERYALLKRNVDNLKLIQMGLTLSDANGQLPDLGTGGLCGFIWEFNFKDFNIHEDLHSPDSIKLLKSAGIDFDKTSTKGIDSRRFACWLITLGIVVGSTRICWVTFHSAYDFGFLIKILTGQCLPESLGMFLTLIKIYFGADWFDLKYMMRHCQGLYGGLDRLASSLQVARLVGRARQPGSDSLLMLQSFMKLKTAYLSGGAEKMHGRLLYGLEVPV